MLSPVPVVTPFDFSFPCCLGASILYAISFSYPDPSEVVVHDSGRSSHSSSCIYYAFSSTILLSTSPTHSFLNQQGPRVCPLVLRTQDDRSRSHLTGAPDTHGPVIDSALPIHSPRVHASFRALPKPQRSTRGRSDVFICRAGTTGTGRAELSGNKYPSAPVFARVSLFPFRNNQRSKKKKDEDSWQLADVRRVRNTKPDRVNNATPYTTLGAQSRVAAHERHVPNTWISDLASISDRSSQRSHLE